jgi:23S rRNA (uracil1939-C5)-methyltransferase
VFRHLQALESTDLERLARFSREFNVDIYLQGGGPNSVRPLDPDAVRQLYYSLPEHDIRIDFEPTDFIQVNARINQLMVGRAVALLDPKAGDEILELFCGIGNFSLPFARHSDRVVAAEADSLLVERARNNASLNKVDNAEFVMADLYSDQVQRLSRYTNCNKLFLDPPRSGAMEVVRDLVPKLRPERIVYVSCNPATLARDSEVLVHREGYSLMAAGIIDMFPHTAHVESIALFQR